MNIKQTSSLLRLPRNLRDRIWSYAYGDLVVHAQPASKDTKFREFGDYGFKYVNCQSLADPLNPHKFPECCPEASNPSSDDKRTLFFWSIVCKQFWVETIEVFYTSATFIVGGSIDLYILASSQQQSVRRMRNLVIRIGLGIEHHSRIWSSRRCSELIKRFESLRGLTLLIGLVLGDNDYTGTMILNDSNGRREVIRAARMEGQAWNKEKMTFPKFLRGFQELNLQENLVQVALFHRVNRKPHDDHQAEIQRTRRNELQNTMKALLFDRPLRQGLVLPDRVAEDEKLLAEYP
jgi:hypothetical protein